MNNLKSMLYGNNILFLAPDFFDYYKLIAARMESYGASVDIILESFSNTSLLYRYFFIKSEKAKFKYTHDYYTKKINELNKSYNYILVIRGEALDELILKTLRNKFPTAKFIMYQWDSVKNNPNAKKISRYFDKCLTFDQRDANTYKWEYRPLFYTNEGKKTQKNRNIDFILVGTLYYQRALLYKAIKQFCENNNYYFYDYLYVRKLEFIVHKFLLKDKRYSILTNKDVKFTPLKTPDLNRLYEESRVFVDYAADDQSGLTMRTIESVGNRCKIITNNKAILKSDIYNPSNVFIYDINDFSIDPEFVNAPYENLDNEIYIKYSLDGWLKDIFHGE